MGHINGRIGSMSYSFLSSITSLSEGVEFILGKYPYYDRDTLIDKYSDMPYSFQMIVESMKGILEINTISKILLFDALIGNSDRHHSNWGITVTKEFLAVEKNEKEVNVMTMSPLYDNGSSLCSYINENDIETILKDKMKYESIINTKSKSAIGWNNIRPIRHFELIKKLKEEYFNETIDFVKNIKKNITEQSIDAILSNFDDTIINNKMKKLLKQFIIERKNRIIEIYNLESED